MSSFSRRSFIKLTGRHGSATVAAAAGTRVRSLTAQRAPAGRAAFAAAALDEKWVRTTCALCPSGCGLEVRVVDGRAVKVEGSAIHPVNQGVCCLRGQASLEMLYSPERIERPRVRNGSKTDPETSWREVSWDEALALVPGSWPSCAMQASPTPPRSCTARPAGRCGRRSIVLWRLTDRPTASRWRVRASMRPEQPCSFRRGSTATRPTT